ncbi:MAG TPA: hypothetical protein GXX59_06780 [Syntrophomonadaceae bacterium]|nr:hypothetical protein [Syntrophomonadaceae bacterium]
MGFLVAFIACASTLSAALAAYYWRLGNHNILLDTAAAHEFIVQHHVSGSEIDCSCLIPLSNKGEQQGMVNNVFCQPVHCGKIMNDLEISSHLRLVRDNMRKNGYWESLILKKNDYFITELAVKIRSRINISSLIREVPCMKMIIYYQVIGRKGIQWRLAEISIPLQKNS